MKKLISLTVMIIMISFTINAQQNQPMKKRGNNFTPDQEATIQSKKLALNLDLNETQQNQVYNLIKENAIHKEKNKAAFKGSEITSEQRFSIANERLDRQIHQKEAMKKILTKEQFDKWEKMKRNNSNCQKQGKKGNPQKFNGRK